MSRRCSAFLVVLALILGSTPAFAQDSGAEQLRRGLLLFSQQRYQEAAESLSRLYADPAARGARPEACYWAARSYAALERLPEARQYLDRFLVDYPSHPLRGEALYQKGRLLVLQGEPESAIEVLGVFVDEYADSDLVSSGHFWIAEALYSLGHIDEAAQLYTDLLQRYPASVKVEASRYRLSLIEFKRREDQLLRLLQWSHRAALEAVREFERREKAYEQAIAAYRAGAGGSGTEAPGLESLRRENAALQARLAELERRLADAESAVQVPASADAADREALLQIMQETLELKRQLLDRLAHEMGVTP